MTIKIKNPLNGEIYGTGKTVLDAIKDYASKLPATAKITGVTEYVNWRDGSNQAVAHLLASQGPGLELHIKAVVDAPYQEVADTMSTHWPIDCG